MNPWEFQAQESGREHDRRADIRDSRSFGGDGRGHGLLTSPVDQSRGGLAGIRPTTTGPTTAGGGGTQFVTLTGTSSGGSPTSWTSELAGIRTKAGFTQVSTPSTQIPVDIEGEFRASFGGITSGTVTVRVYDAPGGTLIGEVTYNVADL